MSRATQTWIIVASLFLSVAALIYSFRSAETVQIAALSPAKGVPTRGVMSSTTAGDDKLSSSASTPTRASNADKPKETTIEKPFTEKFEDVSLTFVPTKNFRRLISYSKPAFRSSDDSSCSAPYQTTDEIIDVKFAYGFVIDRFWTWNEKDGQEEYIVDEASLPRALQGSLYDIVRKGRTVRVTKQRCGMGQVAGLVSVRP